jgi:hypothetical protein
MVALHDCLCLEMFSDCQVSMDRQCVELSKLDFDLVKCGV